MTRPVPLAGPNPLLKVEELARAFGGVRAVNGVSLEVQEGQTVSVIGPNGSGKTTLFNLIAGLLRPDAGRVEFRRHDTTGLPPERVAELGIARTFQNGRVFGNMTVADNVRVGMHRHLVAARPLAALRHGLGVAWISLLAETAMAIAAPAEVRREQHEQGVQVMLELERFGERLAPRADDFAYSLSYANRRRTEIARSLAARPELLLLDEPTAGMNQTETSEMLEQLSKLKAAGQAMLLVEHKLDLVMTLSDHVVVLDEGKVIAEGRPDDIRNNEKVIEAYLGRRRGR